MATTYCEVSGGHPFHAPYHDREYGFPIRRDDRLLERLALEINQAGLSWLTILKKRAAFRRAFEGFAPEVVAAYGPRQRRRLLADAGIVRNRLKVDAVIANARRIVELRESHGSVRPLARCAPPGEPRGVGRSFSARPSGSPAERSCASSCCRPDICPAPITVGAPSTRSSRGAIRPGCGTREGRGPAEEEHGPPHAAFPDSSSKTMRQMRSTSFPRVVVEQRERGEQVRLAEAEEVLHLGVEPGTGFHFREIERGLVDRCGAELLHLGVEGVEDGGRGRALVVEEIGLEEGGAVDVERGSRGRS